jgi:bifunctional DNA-binding transcriptional regulator/antitoxin component of YhaV-PrlF toxin-antitoxin module
MVPGNGPFADSRTVQESNGGFTVSIPKKIARRYGIERGDEVWWVDSPDGEKPEFIPPEQL